MIGEDPYGTAKRLAYVGRIIRGLGPKKVLDVGCGTGSGLTRPLAMEFPDVRFVGVEPHEPTRLLASEKNVLPNLEFVDWSELASGERFGLVIASEVLEHTVDPLDFLRTIASRVAPGGRAFLTFPNGWGPFEWGSLMRGWTRAYIRGDRTNRQKDASIRDLGRNTLSESPHINFFRFRVAKNLLRGAGLEVEEYRGRTFLCGEGLNRFVHSATRSRWNAEVADTLPPQFVSGWMFLVRTGPTVPATFRRGWLQRLHRRLNEQSGEVHQNEK